MKKTDPNMLILFDGICNLCHGAVQFILKNEKDEQLSFASLQSDAAKNILLQYNVKKIEIDSIIFIEDGNLYYKSAAALRISRHLRWPYRMLGMAKIFPKSFSDKLYDFVANHRYKWFGKKESCLMMITAYKNRFISN